jgi:hypothetical protein
MQMDSLTPAVETAGIPDRGAWTRPVLEVLSADETAGGFGPVYDGSGQS